MQKEIIPTLRELGIGIVAYSPLGRGFLTGAVTSVEDFGSVSSAATCPRELEKRCRALPKRLHGLFCFLWT
jgi:aryl-alcohol dehydrogenase-like predicted oxidoreductase